MLLLANLVIHEVSGQRLLPVGNGIAPYGTVNSLIVHDGLMVIGGQYTSFNDHVRPNIQGWDGAQHFDLPGAFEDAGDEVFALLAYQGDLIAAGSDPDLGHIAKWDGTAWHPMGQGYPGIDLRCLAEFEGHLISGGTGGAIQRWNGASWESMGADLGGTVHALAIHNGQLFAGGLFNDRLVRWDAGTWTTIGDGFNGPVKALLSTGTGLLIGGGFNTWYGATMAKPYVSLWANGSLSEPALPSPGTTVQSFLPLDGGRLLIGAFQYNSLLVDGNSADRVIMSVARAACTFLGETYLGGSSFSQANDPLAMGKLVAGLDLARLDANHIGVDILHGPWWFGRQRHAAAPTFEVPRGSSNTFVHRVNPLFTGMAQGSHWFNGAPTSHAMPCTGPNSAASGEEFALRYQQVWKVDRLMIEHHQTHWMEPGYVMPHAIATWPGNGDVDQVEPQQLAPFFDLNGNGIYEPEIGDHPAIRGDQAVYYIQHDPDLPGAFTHRAILDRHVMHYAFWNSWDEHLLNTVFTHVKLINRSDRTYTDARFGLIGSIAIGCEEDDLLGCDTDLDLTYIYNGLPTDQGCDHGLGASPPALGIAWLNTLLAVNSRMYLAPNEAPFDPISGDDAANILRGLSLDGSPLLDPWGEPYTLAFPGDPVTNAGWVDGPLSPAQPPKVYVSATGPFTLAPGDTLCADIAWIHARDSVGGHLASVTLLKEYTALIRQWYQQHIGDCNGGYGVVTQVPDAPHAPTTLLLFPNPAMDQVTLRSADLSGAAEIRLFDARGVLARGLGTTFQNGQATIPLNGLAQGLYTLVLLGDGSPRHARLSITR